MRVRVIRQSGIAITATNLSVLNGLAWNKKIEARYGVPQFF